ncbi:MAG: dihydrolipoamide acetyltransferase family protein [Solirubrobacteraceae bacterium]
MPELVMPRLSDSMEEGTIVRWLKSDGDVVSKGEPIAEIETDKATVTCDADADGTLRIVAGEGATVPLGGVIATIGDVAEARSGSPAPAHSRPAAPSTVAAGKSSESDNGTDRVKASPLARRIARESQVDLRALRGSGPGGRIVKADVPQPTVAHGAKGAVTTLPPSRIQVQIAQRMSESKATIPDFTLHAEVAMEQAVELRTQLRKAGRGGDGEGSAAPDGGASAVPSYNDMVVKACGLALREHPRANAAYRDGAFELYERVNVGIAVAAHDSLVVPTVFDADRKSLLEIAREARMLAERVRSRQVTPAELSGGTFTVSNLGMFGVAGFSAIINPPQAAILAVGELREVPVVRDAQVVPGLRMSIALTCDHRILYGAPAAEFLGRVRQLLEQPINLIV